MRSIIVFAVCALAATRATAQEKVRVTGTKRTVHARSGQQQDIPTGKTSLDVKNVVYEFQFQAMTPTLPKGLHAEWVVMVETMYGHLVPGTTGQQDLQLQFGRPFCLTTDPIRLEAREWSTTWTSGQAESKVFGYGVRILDADDNVFSESYSSDKARKEITWKREQQEQQKKKWEELLQKWGKEHRPGGPARPGAGAGGKAGS